MTRQDAFSLFRLVILSRGSVVRVKVTDIDIW